MLHRLAALLMLFAVIGSQVESMVGVLRDGAVHHESQATAAAHSLQTLATGEHGHEDDSSSEHSHDSGHQHGTSADHCTHQHSPVWTGPCDAVAPGITPESPALIAYRSSDGDRVPPDFFHPPRA